MSVPTSKPWFVRLLQTTISNYGLETGVKSNLIQSSQQIMVQGNREIGEEIPI